MELWTARHSYNGPDKFDITYKSDQVVMVNNDIEGLDPVSFRAEWVRPTQNMVRGYKYGWEDLEDDNKQETERRKQIRYVYMYHKIIEKAWNEHLMEMFEVVKKRPSMTITCYCASTAFCHRFLLVHYLQQLGALYMGERQ